MKTSVAERLDRRLRVKNNERELTDQERSVVYGDNWFMFYGKNSDSVSYTLAQEQVRHTSQEWAKLAREDYDEEEHQKSIALVGYLEDEALYSRASRVNRLAGKITDNLKLLALVGIPSLLGAGCGIGLAALQPDVPSIPTCASVSNEHTVLIRSGNNYHVDQQSPVVMCTVGTQKYMAVTAGSQ